MRKLSRRETIILILTVALAIFFVLFRWFIRPIQEGGMNIDDQILLNHQKLMRDVQLVAEGPIVEKKLEKLVNLVGVAGLEEMQMPVMVSRIDAAANDSNVHISNMQPLRPTNVREANFLSVELEIDGQWRDVVRFLSLLQQPPNFYFINELNLEKYSGNPGALHGRVVISLMSLIKP